MPQYEQRTFETGEVGEDHIWRADLKVRASSARRFRNFRLLTSGAGEVRPGTKRLAPAAGDGWIQAMTVGDDVFFLVITAARLDIYAQATRSLVATVAGCAWTAEMLAELVVSPYGPSAYVFHRLMPPQVIRRAKDGTWGVTAFAFAPGIGGSIRQPYFRFAAKGMTLTPSSRTGATTLTASAAYFAAGHVGLRLWVQGREVQITGVTSPTVASATVIQTLYPTITLPVTSSAGFEIGEVVTGKDSTAEGEVVGLGGGSVTILLFAFTDFYWDAANSKGEILVGRNATSLTTGPQTAASNAAVLDWHEQAISALRGYPGTGTVHKNRLWLARLPLVPFGVLASAIGNLDDFTVGTSDEDSIFEELGDESVGAVQHIFSGEQLLIMTSRKLFYYPESEQNPIRPTSFQVIQVGPDGASGCKPVGISEGVMFAEAGGGSIIGAFPTGDVRRSWRTADVSLLSSHLIEEPRSLAYVSGQDVGSERYVYVVNDDGSMAVVYYSDSAEMFGWSRWTTAGRWRSVSAAAGECWALVGRQRGAEEVFTLEIFDDVRRMDCVCDVFADDRQGPATEHVIESTNGPMQAESVYRCERLALTTPHLLQAGAYIGKVVVDVNGDFGALDVAGGIQLGFGFTTECVPWPPMDAEDQRHRRRKVRISRVLVRWRGRYLTVNGKLQPVFRANESVTDVPPLRDELTAVPMFGWSQEPRATITHAEPGPFTLLGVALEVAR